MRLISFTPSATSARTSAMTLSMVRERCRPRIWGMTQKLHGWLQPSAILVKAVCAGVRRKRGVSKSGM